MGTGVGGAAGAGGTAGSTAGTGGAAGGTSGAWRCAYNANLCTCYNGPDIPAGYDKLDCGAVFPCCIQFDANIDRLVHSCYCYTSAALEAQNVRTCAEKQSVISTQGYTNVAIVNVCPP